MLKKRGLWWIFGPVILAFVMVTALFLAPFSLNYLSNKDIQKASVSFSKNVFKGESVKMAAFSNSKTNYVPFFGSSELLRLDTMHPSVLAAKYKRNYQPFLLGQAGTESLSHYLGMQEMTPALHKKQAVFIISQQWFTKRDSKWAFPQFYSPLQAVNWLRNIKTISATDRFIAKRLLEQKQISDNSFYARLITKIKNNEPLSETDQSLLMLRNRMLLREDQLFSNFAVSNNWDKQVEPALKSLPKTDNVSLIEREAMRVAKKQTGNNKFGIKNSFFRMRVKPSLKKLENSQSHFDYRQSDEYSDFQAVLQEFAKEHTDVLFIIQPVNKRWSKYTGLSTKRYYQSVDKVKKQLKSQGFNQIADFSHDGGHKYFMQDTIHMGWRGWVAADTKIKPFFVRGYQEPTYHINDNYLSKKWQNLIPTDKNLKNFK
ncbi:D-alanyl-lipoteichoic acid biosynthesis protein DltD [Leuconostoc mesenteroides subsp. jonggajibkimchii]|uniref:D-alanyl-lipoteichoic acid biosynthesis protein DltD n=1 Tax=Leuconostoc mesenteroides TaxID=1245 RepID=UPI003CF15D62